MQKKLIALAVAGLASTAAFAQTNVVIYGIADGTFDVVNSRGSDVVVSATNANTGLAANIYPGATSSYSYNNSYNAFNRVSANSSYIGFKGSEDLGNGLKAIFQYETSIDFTAGSGILASRDSFVGLTGGFGTVVLGNITGPTRALGVALDVNAGATGIGANNGLIGKIAGNTLNLASLGNTVTSNNGYCLNKGQTCNSIFDTRWQNAIAYVSPTMGGFTGTAAYVANENKTANYVGGAFPVNAPTFGGTQNTGVGLAVIPSGSAQLNTTGYDLGVKWEGGGFMAGVTYNYVQYGDVGDTHADNLRVGGMYTAGWGSVRAMWELTNADQFSMSTDQQKWGLGGTFNLGKAQLLAQWYGTNDAKGTNNSAANLYEVGVQYNLSKRTMLKAVYAQIDNKDGSAADFGVNSVGIGAGSGVALSGNNVITTTSGLGASIQGVQLGIRHAF